MNHSKIAEITTYRERKTENLLGRDEFDSIAALSLELGFEQVYVLPTKRIVTAHWVGLKCRYGCRNYNTSWCCPPATPSLEKTRELLGEYEVALLLVSSKQNLDFYRRNKRARRVQMKEWKATVAMERKLFLQGYYKAFGISGESCALCEECSFPDNCLFPNEKRPSAESCSIDIFKTIESLGKKIHLAKDNNETYKTYSIILLK